MHRLARLFTAAIVLLAGCATREPAPQVPPMRPAEARALITSLLPPNLADKTGWSTDIHAALASLEIPTTLSNVCAIIGVTEQESGFKADPGVPGLSKIAWQQIEERAERAGVPWLLVRGALQLSSKEGKSYAERIDAVKTERELSEIFEDFIGMVPMGRRLFAGFNPVRTGGPMQVSIEFAERHARDKPYPYPLEGPVRQEVFSRRGGMYFGIAHLLDYPASYDRPLFRFADFNAGHWASRNAALQNAISLITGIPLVLDGDLIRRTPDAEDRPGNTESAARVLGERLRLDHGDIRRDLEKGDGPDLERTALYRRVFELADRLERRPVPRAVVPTIVLRSPKITRRLTTAWFANRVDDRYRRCMARAG